MGKKYSEQELIKTAKELLTSTVVYDKELWEHVGGLVNNLKDRLQAIPFLKARHFDKLPKR